MAKVGRYIIIYVEVSKNRITGNTWTPIDVGNCGLFFRSLEVKLRLI